MVNIVQVQVNQNIAPGLSTLQRTGAIISQGGTTTTSGTATLLTQLADLTPILKGAGAITSMVLAGGTVTVTTTAPHLMTVGDTQLLTIAGVVPIAYNGVFTASITGASTFTFPLAGAPGAVTIQGTFAPEDVTELLSQVTTFFGQGASNSVYVLELGLPVSAILTPAAEGVATLITWIGNNPGKMYSYLVPRYWDNDPAFMALLASFQSPTAKTYFWVTTTLATWTNYTALMKCVHALIEAPLTPRTEFSEAAFFWNSLRYNPSNTNRVAPFAFTYVFGVTPYPTQGNGALLANLKAAGVNVVGTGAEGGISNTMQVWGTMMDGRDFTYWYSVDWMQINIQIAIANEIINGSNNPINPLYYNQNGINRLEGRAAQVGSSAVSFGLALGTVRQVALDGPAYIAALDAGELAGLIAVNAIPFVPYNSVNSSHYKLGIYNGLSIVYTPARGFVSILFNILVTDFVAP